jgi:hypothetical protein
VHLLEDVEDDLLMWVVLTATAAEVLVGPLFDAVNGLEHRDRG